jgi:hypothetical protein
VRPTEVVLAGVPGAAERWAKRRSLTRPDLEGEWIDVDKQL